MTLRQFERRVDEYQDRVFGFACYYLHDREEAQDVTQEVLIRFWKHRRDVDEARVLAWLLRVARNACVDALRRRRSYRQRVAADEETVIRARDDGASPAEKAEELDFQRRLLRALDHLEDPYRSIVILREIQGFTYEEISGAMDLPLNTVKVYLHRGRKKLREHLTEVMQRETV